MSAIDRRPLWRLLTVVTAVSGLFAAAAMAEPTSTIERGALSLQINVLDPIAVLQSGSLPATVTRSGTALLGVAFNGVVASVVGQELPVTDPGAAPIRGLQATIANGPGEFHTATGMMGGLMPLVGQTKVCLFGPCSAAVANLGVPVSDVGGPLGGNAFVTAAVNLTVLGAPWTSGTAAIGTITVMGGNGTSMTQDSFLGPNGLPRLTGMGTMTLHGGSPLQQTSSVMGVHYTNNGVSLVTPVFVSTNIAPSAIVPVFGLFDFVVRTATPEPGTVGVLGAVVALMGMGIARSRKS